MEEEVVNTIVTPEPSEQVKTAALAAMINDTINAEWESLNRIKSDIATLELEAPEETEVKEILKTIQMEKTIHIGMLTKAVSLLDDETQNLMNARIEKAEEVISEPAQDLQ